MLRTIFVLAIATVGLIFAVQGALYSLMFYLWFAYFRPEQWLWTDFISSLNLSYAVGLWTVALTLFSRARLQMNLRVLLLAAFLIQALLSVVLSPHSVYAWPFWIEFAKAAVIAYVIAVLASDQSSFRLILLTIALSLGFEGAKQGWAQLVLNPGATNNNKLPVLGDNNGVAVGMLMLVPILTTLAATSTKRWQRLLFQFMAIGVVYRAISTYSRGGFIAAAALGLFYVLRSHRRVPALIGIVLAVAIIVPALPTAFWDRMSTIKAPAEVTDESALGRLHFWDVAITMANRNPLFGIGHNAYNVAYDEYDFSHGAFGPQRSVHSAWFGVLAELGYPGLILFISQVLLAFAAAWRARRVAALDPELADLRKFAFAIEAALVAFVIGGSFVPFQYNEMFWHVIGLSIALDVMTRAAMLKKGAGPVLADLGVGRGGAAALAS
jgi:putative inorganic carbon (HCO3(-)) transporter